jgi:hypothetical protein
MKRLIFGDPESIKLRDEGEKEYILSKLKDIKCPLCGAKNIEYFEYDRWNKRIGWNFNCKKTCPNSLEYGEKYGFDDAEVWSDFDGKFIDY